MKPFLPYIHVSEPLTFPLLRQVLKPFPPYICVSKPITIPLLRQPLKPFPPYFHVNETRTIHLLRQFVVVVLKPYTVYFHVSELLTQLFPFEDRFGSICLVVITERYCCVSPKGGWYVPYSPTERIVSVLTQ